MKYKVSILLLLIMAVPAMAQRIITIQGGTVTANVTDSQDFLVNLTANVTGVTLTSTATPATGYQVSMKFVQDATGSRTVVFGGNITTTCTVNATANSVTICRWQYTASGNTWADAGGSGSANTNVSGSGVIFAALPPYNVKADGKVCFGNSSTITITGLSTTVSCSTANFTSADIGKEIFGTSGCCGVTSSYTGLLVLPRGTISSISSTTTVIVTVAATAGCTGAGCILVWGSNDDTAWTAAETAWQSGTGKCASLDVPGGMSLISKAHFNNTGTGCNGTEPELDFTGSVIGHGAGVSVLVIEPNFDFTTCTFGGVGGCFFSDVEMIVEEVGLWGAGYGNTGNNAKTMVAPGVGSTFVNVGLIAFGGSDTSLVGIVMNAAFRGYYLIEDGMGRIGGKVTSGASNQAICTSCFFGDNLGAYLQVAANNWFIDFAGQYGTTGGTTGIDQQGKYYGFGATLFACSQTANATAISMSNAVNAETWLSGANFNCGSATSNGIFMNAASQKLHLSNGTVVGGTLNAVNRGAGVVYTSDDTVFVAGSTTSMRPALTTSGNGAIAVSGTGLSRNELGMFTLTAGTTSGATPTVTITFAGTPGGPAAGAPRCDLTLLNGTVDGVAFTGAWNARFSTAITALSTTAVTYTIDNNAVALTNGSTYGGQYSCRFS